MEAEFIWSGGVSQDSASVRAGLYSDSSDVQLLVSTSEDLADPMRSAAVAATEALNDRVAPLSISNLQPDTLYHYAVEVDGRLDDLRGQFRTFPVGASSFQFTVGSCSDTGSTHPVFWTMRGEDPLFHMITGDFYYADIAVDDPNLFRQAYRQNFASPEWSALLQQTSAAYVWDDHDFGPNNSNGDSPSKAAAQSVFREVVPHYDLEHSEAIYQSFTVGRVRVILLDLRSQRDPQSAPDDASKTTLGAEQKAWFKNELLATGAAGQAAVVVSSVPWISASDADTWAGYSTERLELARFISDNGLQNRISMIAGDAHMIAIDDGSNNDYADVGFPVFHAAALDRDGSTKGGPYSHGTYPGRGQYGLVEVIDTGGDSLEIRWTGKNANADVIVQHQFELDLDAPVETTVSQISSGADDVEERGDGSIYTDSTDLELINDPDRGGDQTVGLRFALDVPQGVNIRDAYIQFTADEPTSAATSLTVSVEDTVDANAFSTTPFDVTGRSYLDETASWTPAAWAVGEANTAQRTPSLAAMLSEVVRRPDWQPQNHIAFALDGSGSRVAESFEGLATGAARLFVRYDASPNASSQAPFGGTPVAVEPGFTRVQAEDYDLGGSGVAYNDVTTGNTGGTYRNDDVDIGITTDTPGGHSVGWTRSGEWLEYTVDVAAAGWYDLSLRVARDIDGAGGARISFDGVDRTGTFAIPDTNGWQTWQRVTVPVNLSAGQQVMRVDVDGGGWNLDWLEFASHAQPVTVQAEAATALSGSIRVESNDPVNLGWVRDGDTARYDGLDFGGGVSRSIFHVAVPDGEAGGLIDVLLDDDPNPIATTTVKGTGGWGNYADLVLDLGGTFAGTHDLTLRFRGPGYIVNLDEFALTP